MKSLDVVRKKYGQEIFLPIQSALFSVIPTGSFLLDEIVGVGGYPLGRIVEIYGAESSAKTTLCLMLVREAQRLGLPVAFLDVEGALDLNWAQTIGVNLDPEKFLVILPEWAEQALDILRTLVADFPVIILDSVAALLPKAEAQGEVGDRNIGLTARLMSQTLRMVASVVKRNNSLLVFTNQLRSSIGGYGGAVTTGGQALQYYSTIRLQIYRSGLIGPENAPLGNTLKITVTKNKVAPPRRKVELTLLYDEGISVTQELLDFGLKIGAIKRTGAWYSFEDEKVQGANAARKLLIKNLTLRVNLENQLRQELGLPLVV